MWIKIVLFITTSVESAKSFIIICVNATEDGSRVIDGSPKRNQSVFNTYITSTISKLFGLGPALLGESCGFSSLLYSCSSSVAPPGA